MAAGAKDTWRNRPPETIRPFRTGLAVATLADIPDGCSCTWVPRPRGIPLATTADAPPADPRQPWLNRGYALKFTDASCRFVGRHL